MSTQWLAAHLDDTDLVILDASKHLPASGRDAGDEYIAGHIPGARFLDLGGLVDETSSVPTAAPRADQLAAVLAELGVASTDRIVFYDDSNLKTSARAWFLCRQHGLGNVAILDGGLAKWKAEGRPLDAGSSVSQSKTPLPLKPQGRIRSKADMLGNIEAAAELVVDARDKGRFDGTASDPIHNLPTGHIPGSHNLPFTRLFNDDGTYKTSDALRSEFVAAGIDLDKPVITTCGSGVTASVLLFALHLLGKEDATLYDGSWLEWASDPTTPKAVLAETVGKAG